jgi:hypothetical protein
MHLCAMLMKWRAYSFFLQLVILNSVQLFNIRAQSLPSSFESVVFFHTFIGKPKSFSNLLSSQWLRTFTIFIEPLSLVLSLLLNYFHQWSHVSWGDIDLLSIHCSQWGHEGLHIQRFAIEINSSLRLRLVADGIDWAQVVVLLRLVSMES